MTRLSGRACRELVPALAPGVQGGAEVPGDHQVDNRRLLGALGAALARREGATVAGLVTGVTQDRAGSVTGVRLADGRELGAGAVVLCTGSDTELVAGVPGEFLPPVRPVKGHVVRLAGAGDLLACTVRGLVRGRPCYLVPRRDGSLVVGATSEERGFDRRVQAGAVHALLDDVWALVPGIDELELVECQAGLRPGSPDNGPSIGWTGLDNLAVATGHYRNGILLAPLTADTMVALLENRALPGTLEGFGPERWIDQRRATSADPPPWVRPADGEPVRG